MTDHQGLRLVVKNGRVETVGLSTIDHCDLAMKARTEAEVEKAKNILFRLAAYVVGSAARLRIGDTIIVGDREVKLSAGGHHILKVNLVAGEGAGGHEC